MPSREEMVEALKIAAISCGAFGEHSKEKKLRLLSSQVSAMRCETCEHYDKQHQLCEVVGGSELLIPGYFGCFSHEPREGV